MSQRYCSSFCTKITNGLATLMLKIQSEAVALEAGALRGEGRARGHVDPARQYQRRSLCPQP